MQTLNSISKDVLYATQTYTLLTISQQAEEYLIQDKAYPTQWIVNVN